MVSEMFSLENLFDHPEVKRGMTLRTSRFAEVIELYNPQDYPPELITKDKEIWIGKVETKFFDIVDYADSLREREGVTEEDYLRINEWVKKARNDFKKFVIDVSSKCNHVVGSVDATVHSNNNSNDSATSVDSERKKMAEVEVSINSEKISDGVQSLNADIRKFRDWSAAESHEIELAMNKIDSWKTQMKSLKEKLYSMKRSTNSYDLDNSTLIGSEAALNTLNAELELVVDTIEHEDRERCLYSLNKSKPYDVKFPQFSGSIDEDFLKFQKDVKNCFRVNRIRLEDQPSKLRENLKGSAMKLIPATMTNIDECWDILLGIYGDPY